MRHDNFIAGKKLTIRSRGRLPHWEVDDAIYSVTIRLKDSLPQQVVRSLVEERRAFAAKHPNAVERAKFDAAFALRLDTYLDAGYGSCLFKDPTNAELLANAFRFFDGERYRLHAWCVMPNHAHIMFHLQFGREIANVMKSWKGYTSHRMKRGPVWQEEYFDRIVRGERDYAETARYIVSNPEKAGLRPWPWTWCLG